VVLQATRTKVIAGLLHQHKPGLRSFHGVGAKDTHQPNAYFHAAVVATVAMRKCCEKRPPALPSGGGCGGLSGFESDLVAEVV
jgi:hypothetical protein